MSRLLLSRNLGSKRLAARRHGAAAAAPGSTIFALQRCPNSDNFAPRPPRARAMWTTPTHAHILALAWHDGGRVEAGLVAELLSAHPAAAAELDRDGRLPLHLVRAACLPTCLRCLLVAYASAQHPARCGAKARLHIATTTAAPRCGGATTASTSVCSN
jgi:hypothetical protein